MRNRILIPVLSLLFFACNENKEVPVITDQPVSVLINLRDNSKLLGLDQVYQPDSGLFLKASVLKFYLSDISVQDAGGNWKQIKDAFLYNLEEQKTSFSLTIPRGSRKLSFGIGVPAALNHEDPTVYSNDHPYSIQGGSGMHWNWSSGYRFIIFEGRMDSTASGSFNEPFAYHTGQDTLYRRLEFDLPDQPLGITVDLDAAKFFKSLDLWVDSQTHGTGKLGVATVFTDNFVDAFSVAVAVE